MKRGVKFSDFICQLSEPRFIMGLSSIVVAPILCRRRRMGKANSLKYSKNKSESKWIGFLFILPWLIGLICFKAGPLLMSFILSFMNYNIVSNPRFIGFQNYANMLGDADFINALGISFEYVLLTAPTRLLFSLFIAYLLAQKVAGIGIFRAVYYIPSLMGGNVAIAILWRYMFSENGLINNLLALIGIQGKAWLAGDFSALCVVSLLHVWQFGATMVIFLAAFKGVPSSIIEAATIDGCTPYGIFVKIILPLAKNTFVTIASMYSILIWNDFIFANTFISKDSAKTVAMGLKDYVGAFGNVDWGLTFAAITISILPPMIVYFALNKHVTAGMSAGAVKG